MEMEMETHYLRAHLLLTFLILSERYFVTSAASNTNFANLSPNQKRHSADT